MPRIAIQRVVVGKRVVLLGDGEVQGEPAPQGNHELIHVGDPSQQHRRDEGVGAQVQESVTGVAFVVIGRGVAAADPHGKAGESVTLNFAPHGPLGVPACAPTARVADAPAEPQRRLRNPFDVPAERQTHWGQQPRHERTGWERGPRWPHPAAEDEEPEQRWEEPERSSGQLLTARPVGPREPRGGLEAALPRPQERSRQGAAEIGAMSPQASPKETADHA